MKPYAVVSCHVERPLDDECWSRFVAVQEAARRLPHRGADAAARRRGRRGRAALARARPVGGRARAARASHAFRLAHPRAPGGARPRARRARPERGGVDGGEGTRSDAVLRRRLVPRRAGRGGGRRGRLRRLQRHRLPASLSRCGRAAGRGGGAGARHAPERRAPARASLHALARNGFTRRSAPTLGSRVVHVYFHDTDLLSGAAPSRAHLDARPARPQVPPDRPRRARPRIRRRRSRRAVRPSSSEAGMRRPGSKINVSVATRPLPSEGAPTTRPPPPVGDIRQARASLIVRSPLRQLVIRHRKPRRPDRPRPDRRRPRAVRGAAAAGGLLRHVADLPRPALGPGDRLAPVPAARDRARVLAGRPLRPARAAARLRPDRLVARDRRL